MPIRSLLLLTALSASAPAYATTGLKWAWNDQPQRYLLEAEVKLPVSLDFLAEKNLNARVKGLRFALVTTCHVNAKAGKSGWELACRIDDIAIRGAPVLADAGRLKPILDEIDGNLTGAEAQVVLSSKGQIRDFDLEGLDERNSRTVSMAETLRVVLGRAFAALDLELPKDGDDGGAAWTQPMAMAMHLPWSEGTLGAATLSSQVKKVDGAVAEIETAGNGIVSTGADLGNMEIALKGVSHFDTANGRLLDREYFTEGHSTATRMSNIPYIQSVRATWLPPEAKPPVLGETEELAPHPGDGVQ